MGMTIDESISIFEAKGKYSLTEKENEAKEVAIETMRKYQKIEKIVGEKGMPEWSYQRYMEIASIVRGYEDGNDIT